MSGVSLFMALFVVGSTFGFVVATRRRELGLLRLVGATPRQVRRLVLGESGGRGGPRDSCAGCLLATVARPGSWPWWSPHGWSRSTSRWRPGAVAAVGDRRAQRARSSPCSARGAPRSVRRGSPRWLSSGSPSIERRRPSVVQIVVGVLCPGWRRHGRWSLGTAAEPAVRPGRRDPPARGDGDRPLLRRG